MRPISVGTGIDQAAGAQCDRSCRRDPRHGCTTGSGIRRLGDVGRHAADGWGLVIGHRHREAGGIRVAGGIGGRVGHRRRADGKRVPTGVGARDRRGAVVTRRGGRPRDGCTAVPSVAGLGDVGRHAAQGGRLVVLYRHRGRCRGGVAGPIEDRQGHRVVAEVVTIKVVRGHRHAGDAATSVIGAVVDLGGGDAGVACRIELHRDVLGRRRRIDEVKNRDGGRSRAHIAIVVRHRQGHRVVALVVTIKRRLAQGQGSNAAGVAGSVVHLIGCDARCTRSVEFDGQILGNGRRRDVVLHRDGGGCRCAVAVVVRHRQGHRVGAHVGAAEGRNVQGHGLDATGVAGAIVNVGGRDGTGTGGIELNRDVLRDDGRRDIVLHRHGGRGRAYVAIVVRHCQGHRVGAHIRTVERRNIEGEALDAAGVIGPVVDVLGRDGTGAGGIELNREVLGEGFGRHLIENLDLNGDRAQVARHVHGSHRDRQGHPGVVAIEVRQVRVHRVDGDVVRGGDVVG